MTLTLYYHPLSSYCWKALIALYEGGVVFEPRLVNLGDASERAAFLKIWPLGKFPVLADSNTCATIPESSIIIEYLQDTVAGFPALIPADRSAAREVRLQDRFFDNYVQTPMNVFTSNRLRAKDQRDPLALEAAQRLLETAYNMAESKIADQHWAAGDCFTLADCAAFPALYYADRYVPIGASRPELGAYLARLHARPSIARVFEEAAPFMHFFPGNSPE